MSLLIMWNDEIFDEYKEDVRSQCCLSFSLHAKQVHTGQVDNGTGKRSDASYIDHTDEVG